MDDYGHEFADRRIEDLERRFREIYAQAEREMAEKLEQFAAAYQSKLDEFDVRMAAAKTNEEFLAIYAEFQDWKSRQAAAEQWLRDMVASLADSVIAADQLAAAAIRDDVPTVFAENANYAMYAIESGIGMRTMFTLMDVDTARYLITNDVPELFPKVDMTKDRQVNARRLTSAVTQGILQGEGIPAIARRLRSVSAMDVRAATRAARTACTAAENAGRVNSYQRAERMGIKLQKEWLATLDERTRHTHRMLDGERVDVDDVFIVGDDKLRFPADPEGPAAEVYNCRCTLVAAVDGVDQSAARRWSRLPAGMTYEDWKGRVAERVEDAPIETIPRFTGGASNIAARCGQSFVDGMADTLEQQGTPTARRLFNAYQDDLIVNDPKARGGAYYSPMRSRRGVTFNARKAASGDDCHTPHQTTFHEFAHNIDNVAARRRGVGNAYSWYSYEWNDNALGKSIQGEWDAMVAQTIARSRELITDQEDKFLRALSKMNVRDGVDYRAIRRQIVRGDMTMDDAMDMHGEAIAQGWIELNKRNRFLANDHVVRAMRSELMDDRGLSIYDVGSLSDVVEGCTGISYPFGVGHGKGYWSTPSNQPSEFFAEAIDGQAANATSYQLMEEYFPNSCDLANQIAEEITE